MSGVVNMQAVLDGVRLQMKQKGERKAVRAGAQIMLDAMVERTPVQIEKNAGSNALEPGALRAGMKVRMVQEDGEPLALIGPDDKVDYVARFVEYGHRMVTGGYSKMDADGRTRGSGKVHAIDVPAHPFIRPAFEASQGAALEEVAVVLGEELQKAVQA